MQKLLSIGTDQFFTGTSSAAHSGKGGLFETALGINPFVNPYPESTQVGLLQKSSPPVDISGSSVVDQIRDGVARGGNLYMTGDDGHFYNKDLSNDNAPTDLRSGTPITDAATGIEVYKPQGGTEYLYYWQQAQIGRWDLSGVHPTGWTDNHFTGLQSTIYHPTHPFRGNVYYGNKDRIGMIYNNGGTAANNLNVLDYPSDFTCHCLEDDGTNLVIAINKSSDNTVKNEARILFWDTINTETWNHEWVFPDFTINAIRKVPGGFLAIGGRGAYFFNFSTKPSLLRTLDTNSAPTFGLNVADNYQSGVLWGSGTGHSLNFYGKMVPEAPNAYMTPFDGYAGTPTFIASNIRHQRILLATSSDKLYYYDTTTGGVTTTVPAETVYLPLKTRSKIKMIDVFLGEPLTTSDVCGISVQRDEDNAAVSWGSISHSTWGAARRVRLRNIYTAEQLKLLFDFSAGNVKIKHIDLYGDPLRTN